MVSRIVVGVFESEGIAEDARNRLKTDGVPASDIVLKVLKEIGPVPSTMEPEIEAGFLGPLILGNFRESFAHHIHNGETLVCVEASSDEQVEQAVDTLKQYAPLEVKVVSSGEGVNLWTAMHFGHLIGLLRSLAQSLPELAKFTIALAIIAGIPPLARRPGRSLFHLVRTNQLAEARWAARAAAQAGEGAEIVDAETGRLVERYPPPQ